MFLAKVRSLMLTLRKIRLDCHLIDVPRILTLEERMRLLSWCSCEILVLNMLDSYRLMVEYVYCIYRAMDDAYRAEIHTRNPEA